MGGCGALEIESPQRDFALPVMGWDGGHTHWLIGLSGAQNLPQIKGHVVCFAFLHVWDHP